MAAAPRSKRKVNVAQYLEAQINSSDKSQLEIAEEVGFAKPTMVSMIKLGKAKVPLDKARAVARALGVDEKDFFFRCFEEYLPSVFDELQDLLGNQPILSDSEAEIISRLRQYTDNPQIKTPQQDVAFQKFAESLAG